VKFKLNENLGRAAATVLLEAGCGVIAVSDHPLKET